MSTISNPPRASLCEGVSSRERAFAGALPFVCPVCRRPLVRQRPVGGGASLCCEEGHRFDIARQGYVNLCRRPGSGKRGRTHGDNDAMMAARGAFLSAGHYAFLRDTLAETVKRLLPAGLLLDCGCGEGYYTEALACAGLDTGLCVYGLDLSAKGAGQTARRAHVAGAAVASAYDMPLAQDSCDGVVTVFAPLADKEFARVLKPGGLFFNVIPAARHLWELKRVLYDKPYENRPRHQAPEGFVLEEVIPVEAIMPLDKTAVGALLLMTPYFYRTSREGIEKAMSLDALDVTASFEILVARKE